MRNLTITIERNDPAPPPMPRVRVKQVLPPQKAYRAEPVRATVGTPPEPTTRSIPGQDRLALVLGGATTVWRDLAVLETMIDGFWPGLVFAVNDLACTWPRRIDYWVTIHAEKLKTVSGWRNPNGPNGWIACRRANGYPDAGQIVSHVGKFPNGTTVDKVVKQWDSGSSGLLAVAAAYSVGCQRVVLCGCPMDDRPHFAESVVHDSRMRWSSVRAHRQAWEKNLKRLRERTRSLSGWTRKVLGAPTLEWLEAG